MRSSVATHYFVIPIDWSKTIVVPMNEATMAAVEQLFCDDVIVSSSRWDAYSRTTDDGEPIKPPHIEVVPADEIDRRFERGFAKQQKEAA